MPENKERGSCGENIMSEDYGDFIVEYYFPEDIQAGPSSYCSQAVNNRYASFYVPKREWEPLSYSRIPYSMIPKLYALEDTTRYDGFRNHPGASVCSGAHRAGRADRSYRYGD